LRLSARSIEGTRVHHAPIAPAGLVTRLNFLILNSPDPLHPLGRGVRFWQMARAVQGWPEPKRRVDRFRSEVRTPARHGIRLVSGAGMRILAGAVVSRE
jgi:hypothetical protein